MASAPKSSGGAPPDQSLILPPVATVVELADRVLAESKTFHAKQLAKITPSGRASVGNELFDEGALRFALDVVGCGELLDGA
jgi:hypothetical protein